MNTLKKLEIFGFKSFSNRREIVFPKGLSVIMGPNGSGKSNVGEALCFVLGKSSRKGLRAEKMGDLVYNGGKKLPPSKLAKVTVVIDNKNRRFPLPEDEIKIVRMVDPSSKSVFRVNGIRQPKEYVRSMLGQGGVDPDGYNIVMQGEIEKFIDLSTEDRRRIIEELSGISVYEEKKHKSLLELEQVSQRVKEAGIILIQKEKHMDELKKEKEQAETFVSIRDRLHYKKGSKLKREHDEIIKEQTNVEKKIAGEQKIFESLTSKKTGIETEIGKNEEQIKTLTEELEVKGEGEQVELAHTIEELKIKEVQLNADIKGNENELKRITERIDAINKDVKENESKIKEIDDGGNKNIGILEKIKSSLEALKIKQNRLLNLDKERLELSSKISILETEKIKVEDKVKLFELKITEQKNAEDSKKELLETNEILNKKLGEDSELAGQNREENLRREQLLKQLHLLEGKKAAMLSQLDRGTKAILEAKHNGSIKGIHGMISELGKVNDKYSIPLTVAAGNRVKSVVVDNVEVARECVEFLRKNQLGIATFIPLDKIEQAPEKLKERKGEGFVDYAINLIKFSKKYESAFWYVLGDTVIVDDIESAKKMGIGKNRMVTLLGDLLEKSGVITGGHRQKEKTGFKDSFQEEMDALQEKISEIGSSISAIESRRAGIEGKIIELRGRKHFLESKTINIDVDHGAYEKAKKDFEDKKAEIKKLETEIQDLPKIVDEEEIKKLEEQISKKAGELADLSAKNHGKKFEAEIIGKDNEKSRDIIKGLVKETNKFGQELEENKKILEQTRGKLDKKVEEEKKFQGRLRTLFEKRNELRQKNQEKEIKIVQIEAEEKKITEKINNLKLNIAEIRGRLEGKISALEEFSDLNLGEIKESVEALAREISVLEQTIQKYGAVNLRALDVYKDVEREYLELKTRSETLASEREAVIGALNEIEDKKKEVFIESFNFVAGNFERVFGLLSTNGEGKLILENPEHPFEGGVEIIARPGGKKMISLRAMSGGEKTLTTLAFIFAVQEYNPSPFYILDEVDAALDKENSERLAALLAQYSKQSQFIVVTHNDSITSQADNLYGVHMNELGESTITSIKLGKG